MNDAVVPEADVERDYCWRPGLELRPAPRGLRLDPIWTHQRRVLFSDWIPFEEVPARTPWPDLLVDHLWQGDELMDAVVSRFVQMGMAEGRSMLDQALDLA